MPDELVVITAWDTSEEELSGDVARAFAATDLVVVAPTDDPGRWKLRTGSAVGIAVGEGWQLQVVPRIPVAQLMFLLSYADPRGWRETSTDFGADDLFGAVAHAFLHHASAALRPAPLMGYVPVEESSPVLRGRLLVSAQLARHAGIPMPLEIAYDDFLIDVPENRMILGAAEALLRLPLLPSDTRRSLRHVRALLDGVNAQRPGLEVAAPPTTPLNRRYASALRLAELILRSTGLSTDRGGDKGVTFRFDMNSVFERFLGIALGEAMRRRGAQLVLQDRSRQLDVGGTLQLKPDMTVRRNGRCIAVLDAKYKTLTSTDFPNADAYQALAYCLAFELDRTTLVYALDASVESRPETFDIASADARIEVRAIDVTRPHGEVLAQVDALASDVISSASDSPHRRMGHFMGSRLNLTQASPSG